MGLKFIEFEQGNVKWLLSVDNIASIRFSPATVVVHMKEGEFKSHEFDVPETDTTLEILREAGLLY